MLQRPAYVPEWISTAPMTFRFNNETSLALDNPGNIPEWLGDPLWHVNYKGKAALGLACIEWVAWRLAGLTDVTDLLSRPRTAPRGTASFAGSHLPRIPTSSPRTRCSPRASRVRSTA
ncbi:hypothetical protein SAMN05443572_11017 [Myxococcus fulvus]|uniref:Uncharacterized protein n=1 Tax=Myxococcus fulvus TaxID=33 RepID=A0A511T9W8_MYXFU|nr:hypothetical protein [Myxococcus fulvus]GEN10383.1 hypothetical protein MFU01_54200 [Myxococcus fulvus]SEU34216.1 hypothetical protein SAMN05443572_11017 [Myxococcus fulvus]